MRRGHSRRSGQRRQTLKRTTGVNLIRGSIKRKKVKSASSKREAARRKKITEGIEAVERLILSMSDPKVVALAQFLRTKPGIEGEEELKKSLRDLYIGASRTLLNIKQEKLPQLWWCKANDEATAASVRRVEATLETAIRLIDERTRLIEEALGSAPTSAPPQ
jgi:hypothetical protein